VKPICIQRARRIALASVMLLGFGAAGYSLRRKTPGKLMQVA
jgi:hypothetical protein